MRFHIAVIVLLASAITQAQDRRTYQIEYKATRSGTVDLVAAGLAPGGQHRRVADTAIEGTVRSVRTSATKDDRDPA